MTGLLLSDDAYLAHFLTVLALDDGWTTTALTECERIEAQQRNDEALIMAATGSFLD